MNPQTQKAMQEGAERKRREARKESKRRVKAYRDWLKLDVAHTDKLRKHEAGILRRHPGKRPPMPALPSTHDFNVADDRA